MKRLLVPLVLVGLAWLPSGVSSAWQGTSRSASDIPSGVRSSDFEVVVTTHGEPHGNGQRPDYAQDQDQEIGDDKQVSEQANVIEEGDRLDLLPVAVNAPIVTVGNVNVGPVCVVVLAPTHDPCGGSVHQTAVNELISNNGNYQSNENEQEQEGQAEQEQEQLKAGR